MKVAYNPITQPALTTAPTGNDITFDLPGLNIYARGVRFKGTDTTYSVFKKHAYNGGGYNGLVPAPSYTTTAIRFLREDGVWTMPASSVSNLYTELTNQNLNEYLSEGKWYFAGGGNSVTNKPTGMDAFELYVGRNASGYRYQKIISSNGTVWFRYHDSSQWNTWVRWYTDMNTDQKVLQSATTTTNFRPIVLGYSNSSNVPDLTQPTTQQVYTTTSIYAQPSTGSLWANKLYSGGKLVLTEHQSLDNYVTLDTAQTITGIKTFNGGCLQVKGSSNYTTLLYSVNTSINAPLRDNVWRVYHSNGTGTDRGISLWSYGNNISNQVLSISAYNIGSTLAIPGTEVNSLYMHGLIRATSTITGSGFIKSSSSDLYVLLGGGGHKALSTITSEYDGRYVNVTGDTMTGSLTIATDSVIQWSRNTDYAKIHFKNTGDGDADSYMGFETGDNGNEYFKFSGKAGATLTQWMSIKSSGVTAKGFIKEGSSNNYVLLGDGGHKLVSDFMLKTDELTNNLTTISKALNVTEAWMDTGISSNNLPANGTYVVQVYVGANDDTGNMWYSYNSGIMSWYKDGTNDTDTDEIILHRSGHAYGKTIYLRTAMQGSGVLKLQIGANTNIGATYTYTFKFKRII